MTGSKLGAATACVGCSTGAPTPTTSGASRANRAASASFAPLVVAVLAVTGAAGCTTVTPLQTASVVEPGVYRVGAQLSASPWCTVTLNPLGRCGYLPNGVPTPEFRASARHGLPASFDLGVTAHTSGVFPRGVQFGLMLDAKKELWSMATERSGDRHLVSASLGTGFTSIQQGLFGGRRSTAADVDVPVALWYGYQQGAVELVASPRFVERISFVDLDGDGDREALDTARVGLTVGAFTRGTTRLGITLDYLTGTNDLASGLFTVSAGVLWDLGGPSHEPEETDRAPN